MRSVLIIAKSLVERYKKFEKFFIDLQTEAWNDGIGVCIWDNTIDLFEEDGSLSGWLEKSVPELYEKAGKSEYWNAYILNDIFNSYEKIGEDLQNRTQYSVNPYELSPCVKANEGCDPEQARQELFEKNQLLNLVWMLGGRDVEESTTFNREVSGKNAANDYVKKYALHVQRPVRIYLITPRIYEGLEVREERLARIVKEKCIDDYARLREKSNKDPAAPATDRKENESGADRKEPEEEKTPAPATDRKENGNGADRKEPEEEKTPAPVTDRKENESKADWGAVRMARRHDIESQLRYSTFPGRFQYPQTCRFFVFDLPLEKNVVFDNSWLSCLLAVYTMMLNRWDNGQIVPLQLYRLKITISKELLKEFLERYNASLDAQMRLVDRKINEIEAKIRAAMADAESRSHQEKQKVNVGFPNAETDAFYQHSSFIGIVKELPEYDEAVWSEHNQRVRKATIALFKSIRRCKDMAVSGMKHDFVEAIPELASKKVSKYDVDEIRGIMDEEELGMVRRNLSYEGSRRQFDESVAEAEKKVSERLKERIKKRAAILSVCAAMLLFLVGFIPFVFQSSGLLSVPLAIVVTVVSTLLVGASGIAVLLWRRKRMRRIVEEYNHAVSNCVQRLRDAAEEQGDYLSDVLDYMKKYQLVHGVKRDPGYRTELGYSKFQRRMLDEMAAQCRKLAEMNHFDLDETGLFDCGMVHPDEIKYGEPLRVHNDAIFGEGAFNAEQNTIRIPFEFVDEISLRVLPVYQLSPSECPDETGETAKSPDETGETAKSPDETGETAKSPDEPDETGETAKSPDETGEAAKSPDETGETAKDTDKTGEKTGAYRVGYYWDPVGFEEGRMSRSDIGG